MKALDREAELRAARILVIDDVPANVEILAETLLGDGYHRVDTTTSPREGLARAAAQRPDLILLDMRMPEMDGHEFLTQLRKLPNGARCSVIVITAQTDDDTKRRALAAGVRDFITKPFMLWELLHRVRNTLEFDLSAKRTEQLNTELERRVQERTQELEATRKEVIRRLATAGEFRDNETGQHVVRMSHFAHHLAVAAGLPEDDAVAIRDAAPLHDIGKIGIPDAILLKPGRLDQEEWHVMKRHAEIGGEILADSGFALLDLARSIALTHHEQWDGSGYPLGLKGDEIPIAGRLTAIADVFDALLSERPYKPRWPVGQAMDFLKDRAGKHFDPRLVIMFERELPTILDLKERFKDVEETPGQTEAWAARS